MIVCVWVVFLGRALCAWCSIAAYKPSRKHRPSKDRWRHVRVKIVSDRSHAISLSCRVGFFFLIHARLIGLSCAGAKQRSILPCANGRWIVTWQKKNLPKKSMGKKVRDWSFYGGKLRDRSAKILLNSGKEAVLQPDLLLFLKLSRIWLFRSQA